MSRTTPVVGFTTYEVEKLGFSVTFGRDEFAHPDIRRQSRKAVRKGMAEHREAEGYGSLSAPSITATESWFEYSTARPAYRRWWHRLLFLHPVEDVIELYPVPYFLPGAKRYVDHWEQHVVKAPAEHHDALRATWQRTKNATDITVATPTTGDTDDEA